MSAHRAGPLAWNQGNTGTIRTSLRGKVVPAPKLGNNRLATGFASESAAPSPASSLESGETHSTPIEISSDEEESEGGMQLNIREQATPEVIDLDSDSDSDDDDDDDEEMEHSQNNEQAVVSTSLSPPVVGDPDAHMQLQGELERHLSNDFQPLSIDAAVKKQPIIRLADLSADELEIQYKYCFYGLRRDQIDLSRPVICIECLQDGHTDSTCAEKHCTRCDDTSPHSSRDCPKHPRCTKCRERGHDAGKCQSKLKQAVSCEYCSSTHHIEIDCTLRFFPALKPTNNAGIKLWISCCNCASKTHLVGDCPALHPDKAPRWSLRTLDASQISNLSLQTGIRGIEKAAENRNMRPQNRDIRPAKQRAPVNVTQNTRKTFDDDSDSFIRPPVARNQRGNINFARPQQSSSRNLYYSPSRRSPEPTHYDRYDAPSTNTNTRSRGSFYQTDSFGQRRRSRSPARDSYHPYEQAPPKKNWPPAPPRGDYARSGDFGRGRDRDGQPRPSLVREMLPREVGGDRYRPGQGGGQGQKNQRGRGGYYN